MRSTSTTFARGGVILAIVAAVAFAVPAQATPPASEPFSFTESEPVPCDGFDAVLERQLSGRESVYFDSAGNPVRVQIAARMLGSVTNSVTGKQLPIRGRVHFVIDLVNGTQTFDGQVFMGNAPGEGVVIQDTGRFVVDFDGNVTFVAGPHEAVDLGAQVFCDAVG